MADRVAVFNDGRIMQIGTPEEIYQRPKTALRRRFRRLVQCPAAGFRPRAIPASIAGPACDPNPFASAVPQKGDGVAAARSSRRNYLGAATKTGARRRRAAAARDRAGRRRPAGGRRGGRTHLQPRASASDGRAGMSVTAPCCALRLAAILPGGGGLRGALVRPVLAQAEAASVPDAAAAGAVARHRLYRLAVRAAAAEFFLDRRVLRPDQPCSSR